MKYHTRSVKGRAREANHDCAGAVCEDDIGLFVIADGSSKPGSGQLAECFVQGVLAACQVHLSQKAAEAGHDAVELVLRRVLAELHPVLFASQTGSMCYLVGVVAHGKLTLAYEGDCSCGVVAPTGSIAWVTAPHCLANWMRDRSHRELVQDPARNRVTRCLKAGRTPAPEFVYQRLSTSERLVFVTDGFWAELTDAQQISLLEAPDCEFGVVDDDVTWIDVRL